MNCNVGDLAIVVQARCSENIGCLVRVLRPARATKSGPAWWVDAQKPRPTIYNGEYQIHQEAICPDAWLWPISDVDESGMRCRSRECVPQGERV